jgi:hypothetical protein
MVAVYDYLCSSVKTFTIRTLSFLEGRACLTNGCAGRNQCKVSCSYGISLILLFYFSCFPGTDLMSQPLPDQPGRTIAILDVTARNSEISKNVYSLEHICKTIGVPYHTTTEVPDAVRYPLLIISSDVYLTFTYSEQLALRNYVNNGGILIAPFVKDPAFFILFGITAYKMATTNFTLTWTDTTSPELRWIDDPLEKTMSLSEPWHPRVNNTCSYTTSSAVPMATYMQYGTTGIARNAYGKGFAYCLGFSFQDLIFMPQIDKDIDAERQYGSGFEPTSDVLMLFIKGVYARFIEYATWKHTLPYNSLPVFVLSHDIDLATSMIVLNDYSTWEKCNNIRSTFFINTKYNSDYQNPAFYDQYIPQMKFLVKQGFDIGSHSVGHLRDFQNLPFGQLGNTKQSYLPYDGVNSSLGGTVLGELEVSKNLLEQDLGITVRSFRPGLLYDPFEIGKALDTTGYTQSSLHSANDVMTNFPYRMARKRAVDTEFTKVLEMPISFFTDPKVSQKTDSIINKLTLVVGQVNANYAPFIVLLHSTNLYKLSVQKELIKSLPPRTLFMDINELATFWLSREAFEFNQDVKNDSATITVPDTFLPVNEQLSLVIRDGRNLKSLVLQTQSGQPIPFLRDNFEQNDLIIYFKEKRNDINQFPVPTIGGPASVCLGSGAVQYTTEPGMLNYVWDIPQGGTILSGAGSDTISVLWNTSGVQAVSVTYASEFGCTATNATVKNIQVNPQPLQPALTGPATTCEGTASAVYATEGNMSGYNWNISAEGQITSGIGTNSIQVTWLTPGTGKIGINYTNADGCSAIAPSEQIVTVKPLPGIAGAVTGNSTVCEDSHSQVYSITPIANVTEYTWTLPPGATIVSGAGSSSITVNFNPGSSSGIASVFGTNTCGVSNTSQLPITVKPLAKAAGTIAGPASVCHGSTGITFSVAPVANATRYTWNIPGGATIVSGAETNTIVVDFNMSALSGPVTVFGSNSCGNGPVSPDFSLMVYPIPPTPQVTVSGITMISSGLQGNQWYFSTSENGIGSMVDGETNQICTPAQTGWYWTQVTLNGCSSNLSNRVFRLKPGEANRYNLYPVPNKGEFTMAITTADEKEFSIYVYNQAGRKYYEKNGLRINGEFREYINLSSPASGIYTVVIKSKDGNVVKKIIVNR